MNFYCTSKSEFVSTSVSPCVYISQQEKKLRSLESNFQERYKSKRSEWLFLSRFGFGILFGGWWMLMCILKMSSGKSLMRTEIHRGTIF